MGEPGSGEYWEIEEERSDEEEREGTLVSWVLNKGFGLGKKILFTGFVVSSAPLTLPSLLVISAIGLVVSIPSGVFLASYACSEKLMSKLLPMDVPPEEEEEIIQGKKGESDQYEYEYGDELRGVKRKIEKYSGEEEEEEEALVVVEEIVVVEVNDEKGEPRVVEESTTVVVVVGDDDDKENGVDEKKVIDETDQTTKNKDSSTEETIAQKTTDGQSQTTKGSEGDQGGVEEESKDQPGVSSEKPAQTNDQAKKKKNVKKKQQQQQDRPPAQQKVVYEDEKIWEEIEAVRKIVGYKVAAQKTSFEELKALYVFTGVEPPASFKEPSDLAEVNDKLQFLKSIIGVN